MKNVTHVNSNLLDFHNMLQLTVHILYNKKHRWIKYWVIYTWHKTFGPAVWWKWQTKIHFMGLSYGSNDSIYGNKNLKKKK